MTEQKMIETLCVGVLMFLFEVAILGLIWDAIMCFEYAKELRDKILCVIIVVSLCITDIIAILEVLKLSQFV